MVNLLSRIGRLVIPVVATAACLAGDEPRKRRITRAGPVPYRPVAHQGSELNAPQFGLGHQRPCRDSCFRRPPYQRLRRGAFLGISIGRAPYEKVSLLLTD